jgi:hypothetical protein
MGRSASLELLRGGDSLIDVLDRVLDKGVRIVGPTRASFISIDLVSADTRVAVTAVEIVLTHCESAAAGIARAHPPADALRSAVPATISLEPSTALEPTVSAPPDAIGGKPVVVS